MRWVRTWVVSGPIGLLGEEGGWLGHLTAAWRMWGGWVGDGGAPLLLLLVVRWEGSSAASGLIIEWLDRLEDESTTVEQEEPQETTGVRTVSLFRDLFWERLHLLHSVSASQEKVENFEKKDEEIHLSSGKGSSCSLCTFGQAEIKTTSRWETN